MDNTNNMHLLISRYLSQKDYFSSSPYLSSKHELIKNFIINFFQFIEFLEKTNKIDDDFMKNLYFNIKNAYSLYKNLNFQDKQNWEKRKIYLPYLYSFLEYEFIVNQVILKTYDKLKRANVPLILDKYFSYSHQFNLWNKQIISVYYAELWEKYIRFDEILINEWKLSTNKAYYKQIDISNFYDSIDHDDLIYEFTQFFGPENEKMLFYLKRSLQKITGFKNIWLPQNIVWSDFLATLYIFLKIFNNKDYQNFLGDIKLIKVWDFICFKANYNNHDIYFTNYVDDFTFICKNYKALNQFIEFKILPFLNACWLNINTSKTLSWKISDINYIYKIDLKNIDIKELIDLFIKNIPTESDFKKWEINSIWNLKVYIKWFYRINKEKSSIPEYLLNKLSKVLIYLITVKPQKKLDYEKYFLLNLIRAYPVFFLELSMFLVGYNTSLKNIIEKFVKRYFIFLSGNTIGIVYLNLISKIRQNPVYSNISFLEDILINILNDKYNESNNLFIKKENLKKLWLNILNHTYFNNYTEFFPRNISVLSQSDEKLKLKKVNFMDLYLKDIFGLSISTNKIFEYLLKNKEEEFLERLNYILFELLKTKSLNNNFYYKTASFIEDLYSLIILLLRLWLSLENQCNLKDDLSISKSFGCIANKSKKNKKINLQDYDISLDHLNFLYFILKKRAELVHKDSDMSDITEINELWRYNIYNNKSYFDSAIKSFLRFILEKIKSNIMEPI